MNNRTPISHSFLINNKNMNVYEWPGEGDPILLLHATGFHARCWDQVIHQLPNAPIYAVDALCHGQSDSIDPPYSWLDFSSHLEALLNTLGINNITGVGHSFGGHLLTLACANIPERFKRALLLDPVIGNPDYIKHWQKGAQTNNPVAKRRNQWSSVEELHKQLGGKVPYSTWAPEVFNDYCQFGLSLSDSHDGYQLACPPACEAAIYGTIGAETIYSKLSRIQVPTTIIRAKERTADDAMFDFRPSPTWTELAKQFPNAKDIYCADRTHFFPMEDPAFVAQHITSLYNQ
ncbi:hypothetical protein A9Q99_07495 [Gammaproteobacteria bacterium 45_16_T64]|nr:hypothetical protein A9Q99_07495 [Gammaproteobacteria bacterium 45_16_T64]